MGEGKDENRGKKIIIQEGSTKIPPWEEIQTPCGMESLSALQRLSAAPQLGRLAPGGGGWRTSYGRHQSARGVTATGAWKNSEEVSEWRRKPQAGGRKAERGSDLGAQVQSQCVLTRVSTTLSCDPAGGLSCWPKTNTKAAEAACAHITARKMPPFASAVRSVGNCRSDSLHETHR